MQKSFVSLLNIFISFLFLLVTPGYSFAQSTRGAESLVSFRVEVGNLVCKGGSGSASVLFVTEPQKGGYFEIIGGAIVENGMTLDHRMSFKSGTYTWKGVVNEGYREIPPSIGEFTIPNCDNKASSSVSPAAPSLLKTQPTVAVTEEIQKMAQDKNNTTENVGTTTTTASDTKGSSTPETNQTGTFKTVIFGLVVLGVVLGIFGVKNTNKKTNE